MQLTKAVVGVLSRFMKDDAAKGRISNKDDFKHLARKVMGPGFDG